MSTGNYPSAGQPEPGPGAPSSDRGTGSYGNAPSYSSDGPGVPAAGTAAGPSGGAAERRVTRTGVIWAAVVAALVLLILLIIFILQNQELVLVKFLGFEGAVRWAWRCSSPV